MYCHNGLKAYNGGWVEGDMHGFGTLYDKYVNPYQIGSY